jgi:hypothetical protein
VQTVTITSVVPAYRLRPRRPWESAQQQAAASFLAPRRAPLDPTPDEAASSSSRRPWIGLQQPPPVVDSTVVFAHPTRIYEPEPWQDKPRWNAPWVSVQTPAPVVDTTVVFARARVVEPPAPGEDLRPVRSWLPSFPNFLPVRRRVEDVPFAEDAARPSPRAWLTPAPLCPVVRRVAESSLAEDLALAVRRLSPFEGVSPPTVFARPVPLYADAPAPDYRRLFPAWSVPSAPPTGPYFLLVVQAADCKVSYVDQFQKARQ